MFTKILKNNIENIAKQLGQKKDLESYKLKTMICEVANEFEEKIDLNDQKTMHFIAQEIYLVFRLGGANENIITNLKNILKII
jgi:hypothetical protein